MRKSLLVVSLAALLAACAPGSGDDGDGNFYDGRTIAYIVSTDPGGGYDAYARLIGKYMQEYMPIDNIIIKNTPGAGHLVGAITLHRSRANGLTIGTFNMGLIYSQLLEKAGMQFDLRELDYVGKAAGEPRSIVVSISSVSKSQNDSS